MADPDRWGWKSDLPTFGGASPRVVRIALRSFVCSPRPRQLRPCDVCVQWPHGEWGSGRHLGRTRSRTRQARADAQVGRAVLSHGGTWGCPDSPQAYYYAAATRELAPLSGAPVRDSSGCVRAVPNGSEDQPCSDVVPSLGGDARLRLSPCAKQANALRSRPHRLQCWHADRAEPSPMPPSRHARGAHHERARVCASDSVRAPRMAHGHSGGWDESFFFGIDAPEAFTVELFQHGGRAGECVSRGAPESEPRTLQLAEVWRFEACVR